MKDFTPIKPTDILQMGLFNDAIVTFFAPFSKTAVGLM